MKAGKSMLNTISPSDHRTEQAPATTERLREQVVPDIQIDSVLEITPELLAEYGIRHLVVDLDQTLFAPGEHAISPDIQNHLKQLKETGAIDSLSFATETLRNVKRIAKPLQPTRIFRPYRSGRRLITKSSPQFYERILDELGVAAGTVAMVGDEYLRDIVEPSRANIKTILVAPLAPDYKILEKRRDRDERALSIAKAAVARAGVEKDILPTVEYAGELARPDFELQLPKQARDDFVTTVDRVVASEERGPILVKTMQFEINPETRPIYDALLRARLANKHPRFYYDRVAHQHLRKAGEPNSQAWQIGPLTYRRGDKSALKHEYAERKLLIRSFESQGITRRRDKKRIRGQSRLSHDHIKIARAGSTAWLETGNKREIDYSMVSNLALKTTEPSWVNALQEAATRTDQAYIGPDKLYAVLDETGEAETELLIDEGVQGQSVIFNKALSMINSLAKGDVAQLISQWPPLEMMFGRTVAALNDKAKTGIKVTYLTSPGDYLHPSKIVSKLLDRRTKKLSRHKENVTVINLPRPTHVKGLVIKRRDGRMELLTGTSNMAERPVRNGTREAAVWTKDPQTINQYEAFVADLIENKN